ncbi:PAS domain-containing sensor histidine kinase [Ferruginibacter paludis]|uniref:sensor histidine kinase n=1 Tax=Ferruginibacter paludis TaxID=1310417 RepID=UPI0025B56391|nr:PAS domain-containing sensor histidine kinase [Ferruginibacter paludis]MDN3659484.1 PAS domain-containing sensor histidine kinase [Ferruginibacter paludis]
MFTNISRIDEESYGLLVESVKEYAIFIIDVNGYITTWNKGAEQIKGYTASEIIGEHISVFYTPEEIANNEPETNLQLARAYGRFECEGWRLRKDGTLFWANVIFAALKNDKGELVGFGKVTRDETARKNAAEEINRLNSELTNLLQRSQIETADYKHALDESAIVAITDQKGIIKHVNENFCRISKYSEKELIGQDHRIINSGHHAKAFIKELWTTIANGKIWKGELKNKAKDGTFYWVDTTIVPFLNEHGKPYQYLAIRSDITQRKLFEEELLRVNEEQERTIAARTLELREALAAARELNDIKTRFVSLASHEFRTPLSAILTSASLVNHYLEPEFEDKRNKHIDRIKGAVHHLTNILDDFLSVEKLEQGKIETAGADFNLIPVIEETIDSMEGMVKKRNHEIQFIYSEPISVFQDKKIFRNILLNLLSNAIKYSADGKTIQVITGVKGANVFVSVKDNGIGIPLESQKELFSIFFRANNAAHIQGTGLGLNIVKKYVEMLGGSIYFTSVENEGSTFTIEFPKNL